MHCLLFVVLSRQRTINFTHYWTCLKFKKTLKSTEIFSRRIFSIKVHLEM